MRDSGDGIGLARAGIVVLLHREAIDEESKTPKQR
jgi:hypothetical protein